MSPGCKCWEDAAQQCGNDCLGEFLLRATTTFVCHWTVHTDARCRKLNSLSKPVYLNVKWGKSCAQWLRTAYICTYLCFRTYTPHWTAVTGNAFQSWLVLIHNSVNDCQLQKVQKLLNCIWLAVSLKLYENYWKTKVVLQCSRANSEIK